MFCLNDTIRYFLCPGKTDMRKGINSLCGVVHEKMGYDVRLGDVFIFVNRNRNTMKLLHAEDGGLVLYLKRLENLPVVQVVVEPEGIDLTLYKRMGEECTRTLELEPGKLYAKEIIRPKYGLKDNTTPAPEGTGGIVIAPLPSSPIYKGLAGASMLAEILLQKYEYHVPFYRQVKEFRHLGIRISESTLSGWFKPVCDLLRPLYEELKRQVLQADYIQVDETTVDVINKEKSQTDKEYLWMTRAVMERLVFFHYDNGSRSQQTVKNFLEPFKGYLQSDGYSAYNIFEEKAGVYLVACLAHIRRHFETALEENRSLTVSLRLSAYNHK